MITHRMGSTPKPEQQPVRFYKIIALSFLFLTILLLGVVIFITSKKASITILAKQDNKTIAFDATVGSSESDLLGNVTSSQFSWTEKFQPTGTGQVAGVAEGTVTIYNTGNVAQPLVKTTRLLSSSGILFRISANVVVPAKGQISAHVYSDQKGGENDIGPSDFTIPGLNAEKQKIVYAKSTDPMVGGLTTTGVLSSEDVANAKSEFVEKMKEAFLKTLPPTDSGWERAIASSGAGGDVKEKVGEVVSSFTITGTSTMQVAEYKMDDLRKRIDKEVNGQFDQSSEKILSLSAAPTVALSGVDAKTGFATINVREEMAVTLNENSNKLSPENFFGKSKDEIERYLLGLNHVSRVDVNFSPSWTMTAPSVADKIDVKVVKVK